MTRFFVCIRWGKKNEMLPSVCFAGHRRLLPMDHYLRSFGQSGKCCSKTYYNNLDDDAIVRDYLPFQAGYTAPKQNSNVDKIQRKCCGERSLEINQFTVVNADIIDLKNYLYYQNCDYRWYIPYKRVTNETYLRDGYIAEKENEEYRKKRRRLNKLDKQNALSVEDNNVKSVNGIKGVWAFGTLPYVDVSLNICYDPFHVFSNVITYYFSYITGKRTMQTNVRLFCQNTLSHPCLYTTKGNAIWELSSAAISKVEIKFLQSIIVPKGDRISGFVVFTHPLIIYQH